MTRIFLLFRILVLLCLALPAQAEEGPPYETLPAEWHQSLEAMAEATKLPDLSPEDVRVLRERLASIRGAAEQMTAEAEAELKPLRQQMETLGPAPDEDEPAEPAEIAEQRARISERIAGLENPIKQAGLAITRAGEFDSALSAYARRHTIDALLRPYPFPLAPSTIAIGAAQFLDHVGAIARSPMEAWRALKPEQRQRAVPYRLVLFVLLALLIGWAVRRFVLPRLGRDPALTDPSYARRLIAAVTVALSRGVIPALILGALFYRTQEPDILMTGFFKELVASFCVGAIIFVLAWALARATLAPKHPNWRLEAIPPANARALCRLIVGLAAVFAVDVFLIRSTTGLPVSEELTSLYNFVTDTVEASFVLALMRARYWVLESTDPPPGEPGSPEGPQLRRPGPVWNVFRAVVALIAIATILASFAGYAELGSFLIKRLLGTAVVAGILYLLRGLFRELAGACMVHPLVQGYLNLKDATLQLLTFWLRAVLDLLFFVLAIVFVLPIWGVPRQDIWVWVNRVADGVTIGSVSISIIDLFWAVVAFTATIVISRLVQRALTERILPRMWLDPGVQHSISAGIGYVGVALAIVLASATLGLDLSNLAIIAGALSVGIGFGLQNIVNNFVSGLILLVERPIKVGDWIVAAGHEGFVKKINVRATEIETFQRASVIVPNSELLSSSVINWTHKNRHARLEVPVGVAYGSDVDQVMAVLLDCLKADPQVMDRPEPFVLFEGFGDSSLDFEARGFIANVERIFRVSSDLRVAIYKALAVEGIEIPFPQRDVHLRDIDRLAGAIAGRDTPPAAKSGADTPPAPPAREPGNDGQD